MVQNATDACLEFVAKLYRWREIDNVPGNSQDNGWEQIFEGGVIYPAQ